MEADLKHKAAKEQVINRLQTLHGEKKDLEDGIAHAEEQIEEFRRDLLQIEEEVRSLNESLEFLG